MILTPSTRLVNHRLRQLFIDRRPDRRSTRFVAVSGALAVLTFGVAACSTDLRSSPTGDAATTASDNAASGGSASSGSATASTDNPTCDATVRDAAFAAEVKKQVELLDEALERCSTVEQLTTEINKYDGFTGYSTEYLIVNRCQNADSDEVRNSDVCLVATPTTTVPPTGTTEIVYIAETLDGRQVELRPSPDLPFIDDAPAEIKKTVDVAISRGCDGAYDRRDFWYAAFLQTNSDEPSVFAKHAQNVADVLNCDARPLPVPPEASGDASITAG